MTTQLAITDFTIDDLKIEWQRMMQENKRKYHPDTRDHKRVCLTCRDPCVICGNENQCYERPGNSMITVSPPNVDPMCKVPCYRKFTVLCAKNLKSYRRDGWSNKEATQDLIEVAKNWSVAEKEPERLNSLAVFFKLLAECLHKHYNTFP